MPRHLLFATVWIASLGNCVEVQADRFPPADANRILFLGDSITYGGHYVAMVEAALRLAEPERKWTIVNLGLPSETCTGLTEPGHPFPRPNVHERLDRALAKFDPDVVVVCYGMNDGIYYPFSDKRFQAYQHGIDLLIEKIKAVGARLVLMTPPPFDPLPLRAEGKLRAGGSEKFSWTAIYEDYDDVMARYSKWILRQGNRADRLIDLRTPILRYLDKRRMTQPEFSLSSDGVHLNRQGHALIAKSILLAWGYTSDIPGNEPLLQLIERRELMLRDAWLTHVGHKRPGMAAGLPLEDAKRKAAEFQREIDTLIKAAP